MFGVSLGKLNHFEFIRVFMRFKSCFNNIFLVLFNFYNILILIYFQEKIRLGSSLKIQSIYLFILCDNYE